VRLAGPHDARPQSDDNRPGHTLRAWTGPDGTGRPDEDGILPIPALDVADEQALRTGALQAASAAGRALGWAARDLAGLKVGLALGAGSYWGYAHIGVLHVLRRAGLAVDYIAGTSIGAAVATGHALGYSPDDIGHMMDSMSKGAFRLTVPKVSLLSNAGVVAAIRRVVGDTRIENLSLPLAVVAADILTQREVAFRRGLLWPALLASVSPPGIYPPRRIGPYLLVDGAVLNPVPSNVAAEMGSDTVIAVKLVRQPAAPTTKTPGRAPTVLQMIVHTMGMMQNKITTDTANAATILIEPTFQSSPGLTLRNQGQGRAFIEAGAAAAEATLPRITAALPWLRRR
jgi:NTE family protein